MRAAHTGMHYGMARRPGMQSRSVLVPFLIQLHVGCVFCADIVGMREIKRYQPNTGEHTGHLVIEYIFMYRHPIDL